MTARTRIATVTVGAALALTSFATRASAQITEVARTPLADAAHITFGFLCDDRFVVRNDGTQPVDLEYAVEKGNEHTKLTLDGRESVELASKSKAPVELWMDGKLIAKADKGRRNCRDVQGNSQVTVAPLEVRGDPDDRDRDRSYARAYPYYDPFYFGFYGGYAFRPHFAGISVRVPIIVTRGGGRRR
jgi:hypothetical protein